VLTAQAVTADVAFSPSSSSVAVGSNRAVDITVANVSNLGGYDVYVYFNRAVVHMTSLTDAGFVTSGGNIVVCNTATINNSAGWATDSCATFSPFGTPMPGVSTVTPNTPTALMHASFTGMAAGKSVLTLTGTQGTTVLKDPNDNPIAATLGTGSITVTAAGVGGITQLVDPGGASLQARTSNAKPWPNVFAMFGVGILVVLVVGTGIKMRYSQKSRAH
jgi:hypothetical protein